MRRGALDPGGLGFLAFPAFPAFPAFLAFLAGLVALSAQAGGAPVWQGTWRLAFWGVAAMAVTAGACALLGAVA